ncbi:putative 2OG-Fe(II) oxygenase [Phenylobacterium sp.]|uniref:putative 2OG-Fe(II) oxygenase n=1 Tax=Phenylobacterium sp. TaxID=1871053 RepID=UPI002811FA8B|nr:putative 2OG-Fe(II) oxygenase [Phenylobacterium sp.]
MTAGDHRQAYDLLARGDLQGALRLTAALTAVPLPTAGAYAARAAVLKAADQTQAALAVNREAARRYPASGVTWHNLAATLGDLGLAEEAEAAARRAIALGLAAAETRLVLARALQALHRFDEAEAAFREALALRPDYEEPNTELAQLIWMRTRDRAAALSPLHAALAARPGHPGLRRALAVAQQFTGDPQAARATVEAGLGQPPYDPRLLGLAIDLCCVTGDAAAALRWAAHVTGQDASSHAARAQAQLAAGDGAAAEREAALAVAKAPHDQYALALLATAWRLTGDVRYRELYDYDGLVAAYDLIDPDTAEGSRELAELRDALRRLHRFTAHPFSQSVREGSQATLRLDGGHEPAIERLLQRLREAVGRRVSEGAGRGGPFWGRNTGAAEFSGAWSIRLGASGHHADHIHPRGWISSAFYVSVPDESADAVNRPGWIKFGEPGARTSPRLGPEHFVQPRPGRLVLFPSYMWHGTVPYASAEERMTVAFDALPVAG